MDVAIYMSFGVDVACFTWANSMYHEEIMYNTYTHKL